MNDLIRSLPSRLLPARATDALRNGYHSLATLLRLPESHFTRRVFARAPESPRYLDSDMLPALQARYASPARYHYDALSLEKRGVRRADQLFRLPGGIRATSFLELGCWDGMVGAALSRQGKQVTGIDSRDVGFDRRAMSAGVTLRQMDVANLQFESETFDFVFSYDAFEHFPSPNTAFHEALRVTKKGGYLFLDFGPLYYSAYGEHAYRSITVPYCQFLWPQKVLQEFCQDHGLESIDFNHVNRWSIEAFRRLWSSLGDAVTSVVYRERLNLSHLRLIRCFPSCFRSKSETFDDFTVAGITALFRKNS